MTQYTATVVGMHFREREGVPAKAIVGNMLPGTQLRLEREPDNKFDVNAIKVFSTGNAGEHHIGYIEASVACFVAYDMDDSEDVVCTVDSFEQKRNNLHPIVTIVIDEAGAESP